MGNLIVGNFNLPNPTLEILNMDNLNLGNPTLSNFTLDDPLPCNRTYLCIKKKPPG
jgi:hypothetical protein